VTGIEPFGLAILAIGLIGTAAVLSNRLSERLRVPAPAFFLVFAAVASGLFPHLARLSDSTVQRVVAVALAFILFDGGMHIGWRRFRGAAYAIGWLGVAGTFVTAGVTATAAHRPRGGNRPPGARRGRRTRAARGASRSQGERAGAQWNLEPPAATLGW
jgi:potassium/hydrogen antiporter